MNISRPVAVGAASLLLAAGCGVRERVMRSEVGNMSEYFADEKTKGSELKKLTAHAYTFHQGFNRDLVVDTDEGLVVVDSYSRADASALRKALSESAELRGKPVRMLIYSHYHLDHTGGGAVLEPKAVLAHQKCPQYWADFPKHDALQPTQLLSGDQDLTVGGVRIQLLYLGLSHTDTMYAVFLPDERVLFTADHGFVRSFPPALAVIAGGYGPGYQRSHQRLAQLDFDIWVPSHFGYGTKKDLLEFASFSAEVRKLARAALQKHGLSFERSNFQAIFDDLYYPVKERYGDWHGFEQQALTFLQWAVTSEYLGQ